MKIENLENIIGTVLGNMYEVQASAFTVYLKSGLCWTTIYIDIPCSYDERLTTGYCWVLDVNENDDVFIADFTMYPEESYHHDEIDSIEYKEATVAELYLRKTAWEAGMERRGS